ncbi:T9SS type A sorting domain-containing protein [Segetibacter sp. 3557_3]|uniref:T9SS type A sorting domain-containing protein n=1 Tax=Segetibacter sp. 3557_3 TaxID=2547429 RepID=UPI001058BA92|nr:T9SS type A sorting domain-containing protein [Segetibacter sp. 3557_3]TDH28927.1 T9SS type A sorting domain-containing protein [Segetibacter sp. 3557_3]
MKKNFTLLFTMFSFFRLVAQPGSLDLTFGNGGKVLTSIGSWSEARAMAVQNDGKVVVAGYSFNGTKNNFAVARYNINGSLDLSFNSNGKVTTAIGSGGDYATAIGVQKDGKILVAGYSFNGANDDFAMARYNIDGSLDQLFNGVGFVTLPVSKDFDMVNALAIQDDGKIVLAGMAGNGSSSAIAVARFNSNGSSDQTFNGNGKLIFNIGSSYDNANAVVLQENGKIVIAGYSYKVNRYEFALARLDETGKLDPTFGVDGMVTTGLGEGSAFANAMTLQHNGRFLATGKCYNGSNYDFAIARYDMNGKLDESFGQGGKVISPIGISNDEAFAPAIQADGKIIIAGCSTTGMYSDISLARYLENGTLDMSFGGNGKVTTQVGQAADCGYAVKQYQNRIYIAGGSNNGFSADFALLAYKNDLTSLPLKLTAFTGTLVKSSVYCQWKTEQEQGTNYYQVERSFSGTNYEQVGKVASIKNSLENAYSFIDELGFTSAELVYYRLKMVDQDGRFTYSKVISVRLPKRISISVSPNPANGFTQIKGNNLANVILLNNAGKVVLNRKVINGTTCIINTSTLAKGLYLVRVSDEKGNLTTSKLAVH